jgi:hypothetical protein
MLSQTATVWPCNNSTLESTHSNTPSRQQTRITPHDKIFWVLFTSIAAAFANNILQNEKLPITNYQSLPA